ncbi:uncharacterized protein LOC120081938 [Benincasa hispida]|uniref:uncharacterized protein LOC120081938 n=1 Tax=Benincasa hispida TaxID=102211 RepID=UPI0019014ABD|nr:uncharacterized protein LOC120081938 [Benincasa hispida]
MYVTRPLSLYRDTSSSSSSSALEPEGPNTGVLVIEDEASELRWFFGLLKDTSVAVPPFPQNKLLELRYLKHSAAHNRRHWHHLTDYFYAWLIPVLNQPPNSNQYYIINSRGKTKGLACTSSKEDDIISCCCFNFIDDIQPQLFDPRSPYQQFQITNKYTYFGSHDGFVSKSMASDGVPPYFLRHQGWTANTKTLENFEAWPALGINPTLRARLPKLDSIDPVVVGKWYCPFIFIREGEIGAQMRDSTYYEMTLQQNWKEIFRCYNNNKNSTNGDVLVDVCVKREAVLVRETLLTTKRVVVSDGIMWFGPSSEVGLSMAIVERVQWEEERVGFVWGESHEDQEIERVVRREVFKGKGVWKRFGCYVLVERFVLKRMDGTLALTWEFRHTHQIRTKWE